MHPGMFYWWKRAHAARMAGCEARASHGCHGFGGHHGWGDDPDDVRFASGPDDSGDGGAFGVRRPLRFLAHKLDLNEAQVTELAAILNELKTERAQVAVDHRRTTSSFADAFTADVFDEAKVASAADQRVKSAERLRDAIVKALGKIHAILEPQQRQKLAYLIRTGALSI